jgi:hypothetical protein
MSGLERFVPSLRSIHSWISREPRTPINLYQMEMKLGKIQETVNRFVREKLKAKLKVPRPQSLKQVDGAVTGFKKTSDWC